MNKCISSFTLAPVVLVLILGFSSHLLAVDYDLVDDDCIDWKDLGVFAGNWLLDCNSQNNWCDGANFYSDNNTVDYVDFSMFGSRWLSEPEPNLVGFWKFDEGYGQTAYDSSGNGNDGTLYGAAWTAGQINGALSFDGDGDYVDCGTDSSLNITDEITIAAWVKVPELAIWQGLVAKWTTGDRSYGLFIDGNNKFVFYLTSTGSAPISMVASNSVPNVDEWYHVVGVRRANTMYLYIDSVEQTDTSEFAGSIWASTTFLEIGAYEEGDNSFNGTIDDVRIYDRALSAGEVSQLYQPESAYKAFDPTPADGAGGLDPNVVLSWSPGRDANSHDVYFGTDFSDVNDANNSWPVASGPNDPNVYKGNQVLDANSYDPCGLEYGRTYFWRIDEVSGPNTYKGDTWRFNVPEPNLVGFWKLDEGSGIITYDSAGDNEGILVNGPNWTAGQVDGALHFDGIDDYVDIGQVGQLTVWTVSLWFKSDTKGQDRTFISQDQSGYNDDLLFGIAPDGWVTPYHRIAAVLQNNGDSTRYIVEDDQNIVVGDWYCAVVTYDGAAMALYVNGAPKDTVTGSNLGISNQAFAVGKNPKYSSPYEQFRGAIDDVRIYNRSLSPQEIAGLYQDGAGGKAFNPHPADGAVNVDPNAVLSWTIGSYATSHDVYFGTDFNDVNDANNSWPVAAGPNDPNVYKGNQPLEDNFYDPCGLDPETAYYWRIDEVNDSNDRCKGDVWSFTTLGEPGSHLAGWWKFDEGSGTDANDSSGCGNDGTLYGDPNWVTGQIDKSLYFDGVDDYVDLGTDTFSTLSEGTISAWIKRGDYSHQTYIFAAGWGTAFDFLDFFVSNGYQLYLRYTVDGSIDFYARSNTILSTDWHHVAYTTNSQGNVFYIDGSPEVMYYSPGDAEYNIFFNDVPSGGQFTTIGAQRNAGYIYPGKGLIDDVRVYDRSLSAAEIEGVYLSGLGSIARAPYPADNAGGVDPNVVLSWLAAEDANSHDVYFGTDFSDVNDANNSWPVAAGPNDPNVYKGNHAADANFYDPCGLEYGSTYFWRIDEVNGPNTWRGDAWSFTTLTEFGADLVGWWRLDETGGVVAYDSSASGNNGRRIKGAWAPDGGKFDGAVSFGDSSYSRIDISNTAMSNTAGTVSLWGYIDSNQTQSGYRFFFGTNDSGGNRIQLYMNTGTVLALGLGDNHTKNTNIMTLAVDTWHHIALTWDDPNYVVYVNGIEKDRGTYTGLADIPDGLNIGNNGDAISGDRNQTFKGLIDEVRIFDRALGCTDIADLAGISVINYAWAPSPRNSAADVDPNVVLSWIAATYADSHDVYFGTNQAEVADANNSWPVASGPNDPNVYKGNQAADANYYDPCGLEYFTSYYWRVDERIDSNVYKGDLWSFTTAREPYPPDKATNPNPNDLASDVKIYGNLSWTIGSYATSHDVYFGADFNDVNDANDTWPIASGPSDPNVYKGNQLASIFDPVAMNVSTTYYWRVDQKNKYGMAAGDIWQFTTESVATAPLKATNVSPSHLESGVDRGHNLNWTAGYGAKSNDVYFSTDFNDVNDANNTWPVATGPDDPNVYKGSRTAVSFDPGLMDANTTYYWRVDQNNPAGTTTGDIWSFTTRQSAVGTMDELLWSQVLAQDWDPNGTKAASLSSFNGVHPRILLTATDVNDLKDIINDANYPTHRDLWKFIRTKANSYVGTEPPSNYEGEEDMRSAGRGVPWMALAYLLTDDPNYLSSAEHWMATICGYPEWDGDQSLGAGECLFGISIGYDWLYSNLTEPNRIVIRDKLIYQAGEMMDTPTHYDKYLANHCHVEHSGMAAAGFALYDDAAAPNAIDWIERADLVFQTAFNVGSYDGSSSEGHQYWGYSMESLLCFTEAARDLMNTNYYSSKWIQSAADFIILSTLPDYEVEKCVMSFGDSGRDTFWDYRSHGPTHTLYLLASEYNNGYAQWLADQMFDRGVGFTSIDFRAWANLLWYDRSIQPVPIANLPTYRHFDDIGWVTSRSGWDEDAVMVGFKCGPMHGHKVQPYYEKQYDEAWDPYHTIVNGHGHPDVDSFQIYAYGKWLGIDPGKELGKYTSSHCTILANELGQWGEGSTWFDRTAVLDANASSGIIRAETNADYDYVVGDAKNIYRDPSLSTFYRHFVYIKPDFILVADELEASVASNYFQWRLHAEDEIDKQTDDYYILENNSDSDIVLMDVHFIHPGTISTSISGEYLIADFDSTGSDLLAAVLHPRRDEDPASSITSSSFVDSVLYLTISCGTETINVELDLAAQSVTVY